MMISNCIVPHWRESSNECLSVVYVSFVVCDNCSYIFYYEKKLLQGTIYT